jgi:quercetin dioxygenase-like cupin family protein
MTPFPRLRDIPARELFGSAIRGHYAHANAMTIGEVLLDPNTTVPMHQHPHEQLTFVIEGRFEFTVGAESTILEPGMTALIPANVVHGGRTLTACRVIDVFSPTRDDYR